MNQIYQICKKIDDEFDEKQRKLNEDKLKRLYEEMKINNIPITENVPDIENGFHWSDDYCLAVTYLDDISRDLWLSEHPYILEKKKED